MTKHQFAKLARLNATPAQRIRNEQLYRENNRRISQTVQGLMEQAETLDYPIRFGCECANAQCLGEFLMTTEQFEQVHEPERMFVICPGHEELDIEDVVEKYASHYTVRKHRLEAVHGQ